MVKNTPETADEIIAYAKQRSITDLELITSESLLNWKTAVPELRDGAL